MAITVDDYVKSDAKVKAARAKLATANERVSKLTGVNLPGAKASLESAKAEVTKAQAEYNRARSNARKYFTQNKEQIVATEEKKIAAEKQKSAEAVSRITGSGLLSESQLEAVSRAGKKPVPTPVSGGAGEQGVQGAVSTIDTINKSLAAEADPKNVTNKLAKLSDAERLNLAKVLRSAGYKDVLETGIYNRGLVEAYTSALAEAQAENTFNKDVKGFKPYNLSDYLSYRTSLVNAGKGAGTRTTFDIVEVTDVDAAAYIENAFKSELNRTPTANEIKALIPAVKAYAKANPIKRTVSGQTRSATSGPNPVDWITQVIRGQQQIVGFSPKEKKKEERANRVVGKLAEELKTKKGQTLGNYTEDILKTVRNNGLGKAISQSQIDSWAKRLQRGESQDAIDREIRNIAKIGMPDSVKSLLDSGTDLNTIYSPYKTTMAAVLELNPESISLDDSVLRKAIGPNGEMPIYEFERALRQDGRWQYTNNAKKEVSDAALRVLRDFGFQG